MNSYCDVCELNHCTECHYGPTEEERRRYALLQAAAALRPIWQLQQYSSAWARTEAIKQAELMLAEIERVKE